MSAQPFDAAAGDGGLLDILQEDTGFEPWMTDALCAQIDPEIFFPEKGGSTKDAKKICQSCEVRSQCLDFALRGDERFGIWGGASERDRRRLKADGKTEALADEPDAEDEPTDEAKTETAAEAVRLPAMPVYDNTVTVRQAEPVLEPLAGDTRLLVLNCLSIISASGGAVTDFRKLLRRLGFSSEQQFLRFLRMQERRGFLVCQMSNIAASRISLTEAGRQYLAGNRLGHDTQDYQKGSEKMKDEKRFPAIREYVESLPDQILVVSGRPNSLPHELLKAAKLDGLNDLRRVLRKLGREVLDAELTEDLSDGSMMLSFGKVPEEVQTEVVILQEPAEAVVQEDVEAPAEILAEPAQDDPAEPEETGLAELEAVEQPPPASAVVPQIPEQRVSLEARTQPATRDLKILRWFADQGGEVPVPGPQVAEFLGISLIGARDILKHLRRSKGLLDSRGKTRGTVYFLTAAGWEMLGESAPEAAPEMPAPEEMAERSAEVHPEECPAATTGPDTEQAAQAAESSLELTPLQAAALRWFAAQSGDIFAPRTKLAEDLGVTRTAAKKLIYVLRAIGYVETDGPTVTCRYFLTETGAESAAALPETAGPVTPPENKARPEAALAVAMARTRALLQALAQEPEQRWYRCKAVDINLRLPAGLRFSDSSDLNKFLRRLALSGLVEQECKGSHRHWIGITREGLDWLRLRQPTAIGKDLELTPSPAPAPVSVLAHRPLPRSMPMEEARLIEVCRQLYDRPNHYWPSPVMQEINDALPERLQLSTAANLNSVIRLAVARRLAEQSVNGRRRLYARLTEQGVGLVTSYMEVQPGALVHPEPVKPSPEEESGEVLRMADGFSLSIDAIVKRFAILGTSGSGKTSTAVVMVEEMVRLGWPVAILDPQGVWWGLRSSADGQSPGLPILIIGGEHGDIDLDPEDGWRVARMIEELRRPVIIDTYDFDDEQRSRFAKEFFNAVYTRPRTARPIHLVIDEADEFAPQNTLPGIDKEEAKALKNAALRLAKRGRTRGIGQTWITQRPQEFHKGVLGQLEVLVAMRFTSARDIQVINEWLSSHNGDAEVAQVKKVLPELDTGQGLFYCPHWLGPLKKVKVRPRWTYDSSATPDPRQPAQDPEVMAEVSLEELIPYFAGQLTPAGADAEDDDDLLDGSGETEEPLAPQVPPAEVVSAAPAAATEAEVGANAAAMVELMSRHLALSLEHDRLQVQFRQASEQLLEAEVARSEAETAVQVLREQIESMQQALNKAEETAALHRRVMQALVDQLPQHAADKVILSLVGVS